MDAVTGAILWTYTTNGAVTQSPAVADGKVYVGANDQKIYCLNATDGTSIWNFTAASHGDVVVCDGKAYIGSYDCNVYCVNATDGTYIWSYEIESSVLPYPTVADGKVYVGEQVTTAPGGGWIYNCKFYCLNATTGAYIWNYTN